MRRTAISCLLAAGLVAPGSAVAARDPDLWATINLCDTLNAPNAMGVRASIPGNGTRQQMFMRFHARYYSLTRQAWYPVEGDGESPWIRVGNARIRARQAGYTFTFAQPSPDAHFVVRGVVEMQWRKRKKVVDRVRATTRHGIENVRGGDPPGTSEGLCQIK